MENFEKILLFHFEKYPLMEPVDAVKLCFQSAFGCGHLVKNEEFALSMLRKELSETEKIKNYILKQMSHGSCVSPCSFMNSCENSSYSIREARS